mgnify:CR=1 FL=1
MRINTNGMIIEFNGSHTANVTDVWGNKDMFTFAFEKDRASNLDFLSAALSYLEDEGLGECLACKNGQHGIASWRNANVCACCSEIVGAENLMES